MKPAVDGRHTARRPRRWRLAWLVRAGGLACLVLLVGGAGAPPVKDSGTDVFSLEPRSLSGVIQRIVTQLDAGLGPGGSRLAVASFVRTSAGPC